LPKNINFGGEIDSEGCLEDI